MKQITDIENIINRLTEDESEYEVVDGKRVEVTDNSGLTDFQKLLGVIKGNLSSEVFDDD